MWNPCPEIAWHYTKRLRNRSSPPWGCAGMRQWSICPDIWRAGGQHNGGEVVSRGRLRWRCGAVWDALWGWRGSARPIFQWQVLRLENHQTSSAIHIWMAAIDEPWVAVCGLGSILCVCGCVADRGEQGDTVCAERISIVLFTYTEESKFKHDSWEL